MPEVRESITAVPVFKISEHALLQKDTPKSIVQVGGNRYLRLMDTGNCGWWAQEAEIHIDTDVTDQWAPRGREEVTGCFDSLPPLNGSLSTDLGRSHRHRHETGRRRVCVGLDGDNCVCPGAGTCARFVWLQTDQFLSHPPGFSLWSSAG